MCSCFSVVPFITARSYREPTTIARRLRNVMIPIMASRTIETMPALTHHCGSIPVCPFVAKRISGRVGGKKTNPTQVTRQSFLLGSRLLTARAPSPVGFLFWILSWFRSPRGYAGLYLVSSTRLEVAIKLVGLAPGTYNYPILHRVKHLNRMTAYFRLQYNILIFVPVTT